MKITIICGENMDGEVSEEMVVDDKKACSVYPLYECPEDAIIGRSLISCQEIAEFMKMAYEAGVNGEDFDIEIVDEDEQ